MAKAARSDYTAKIISHIPNWLTVSLIYYVGLLTIIVALMIPMSPSRRFPALYVSDIHKLAAWDGEWYTTVVLHGYRYMPTQTSSVAFYPLFPSLAWSVRQITGFAAEWALVIVAHAFLIASIWIFHAYLIVRSSQRNDLSDDTRSQQNRFANRVNRLSLLAFTFYPVTFYFRFAYTESLFLFLGLLVFYGLRRGWRMELLALIVGLSTATRAVGFVFALPVIWEAGRQLFWLNGNKLNLPKAAPLPTTRYRFYWPLQGARFLLIAGLCFWGITAYMFYQYQAFGEPFAFIKTQAHWGDRAVPDFWTYLALLARCEPFFATYDPNSVCYWRNFVPNENPLFSMAFANPIWLAIAVVLVMVGTMKGWLSRSEWIVAALLILIPYVLQGYRMSMHSQARFTSVVFPIYIVLGQLLARLPNWLVVVLTLLSISLFMIYAAHFAAWYDYY